MDDNQKREAIKALGGPAWKEKVAKMSIEQVVAIYLRARAQGKI